MGEILNSLGLGPKAPTPATHPMAAMSGMHTPPINGAPNPVAPTSAPSAPEEAPIIVDVDGWKPKKAGFLGGAVDGYLMAQGMQPVFGPKRERENVAAALGNFNSDPEQALKRLMQIPGMQGKAMEYYNQLYDNRRADAVAESAAEARNMKHAGRLGGMLSAITSSSDPAGQYERMLPNLRSYAEKYKLPFELPDKYDETAIRTQMMGGVDVDDQLKIEGLEQYRRSRLGQIDRTIDDRNTRFYEGEDRKDRRADQTEGGRERRFNKRYPDPVFIKTDKGTMELSPSGQTGRMNGELWRKGENGQWVKIKK